MKYKGYVYMIKNKINGKIYIGQTYNKKGYKQRWNRHKSDLKLNRHKNTYLQDECNIFGLEAFEFILLDEIILSNIELLEKVLLDLEAFYITLWNTFEENKGYNRVVGNEVIVCKKKRTKKVKCISTGEIFNSSKEIMDKMFPGKSHSNLRMHLSGKTEYAFGYKFEYID